MSCGTIEAVPSEPAISGGVTLSAPYATIRADLEGGALQREVSGEHSTRDIVAAGTRSPVRTLI